MSGDVQPRKRNKDKKRRRGKINQKYITVFDMQESQVFDPTFWFLLIAILLN